MIKKILWLFVFLVSCEENQISISKSQGTQKSAILNASHYESLIYHNDYRKTLIMINNEIESLKPRTKKEILPYYSIVTCLDKVQLQEPQNSDELERLYHNIVGLREYSNEKNDSSLELVLDWFESEVGERLRLSLEGRATELGQGDVRIRKDTPFIENPAPKGHGEK